MFEHEIFVRFYGSGRWNAPVLRVQPASLMQQYIVFSSPNIHSFRAYSLAVVSLENGSILPRSINFPPPCVFSTREEPDAFLDIYGGDLREWHLLQGISISGIKKKEPFYLAHIDPSETMIIDIYRAGQKSAFQVNCTEATPYGELISIRANHEIELQHKLSEEISQIRRKHNKEVKRDVQLPIANAFLHASDYYSEKGKDYESVAVLVGNFKRD